MKLLRRVTHIPRIKRYVAASATALVFAASLFVGNVQPGHAAEAPATCVEADMYCPVTTALSLGDTLGNYPEPAIASPVVSMFATPAFAVHKPITQTVTYSVSSKGSTTTNLDTFKQQVQAIFDDPRGWSRLGVRFERVATGGQFTVVLTEASQVPTFGSICDTVYSCNVGNYVVVNEARWIGATDPWNQAGGNITDYRHLLINHETGHWLGHGHTACTVAGGAAPVMDQQSINLHGCKFNSWPLDSEIWSTTLGIT